MPTQIELSYILRKHAKEDLFDSDLPIRILIAGEIRFLNQNAINAEAPNAILGMRLQQAPSKQILHFSRLAQGGGLTFPDQTQADLPLKRISFRILSNLVDSQGQQVDFSISYDINRTNYHIIQGNVLPGNQWVALVTFENGNFSLLHVKLDDVSPGGGNPCAELGCAEPDRNIPTAIICILNGCG